MKVISKMIILVSILSLLFCLSGCSKVPNRENKPEEPPTALEATTADTSNEDNEKADTAELNAAAGITKDEPVGLPAETVPSASSADASTGTSVQQEPPKDTDIPAKTDSESGVKGPPSAGPSDSKPGASSGGSTESDTGNKPAADSSTMSWEEFDALSASEKDAYMQSFDDLEAFTEWLLKAQADYTENHPTEEIGADGMITIGS